MDYTIECRRKLTSAYGGIEDEIEITRFGVNDYQVYFVNGDYSVRGDLIDIVAEIAHVFYE